MSAAVSAPLSASIPQFLLVVALAALLIRAAWTDYKTRSISNPLNIAIAVLAIPYWLAKGAPFYPDAALQIAVAAGVFGFFFVLWWIGQMGAGDVKMMGALALWFDWVSVLNLLVFITFAGAAISLVMVIHKYATKPERQPEVPYGIAIAAGGLVILYQQYFNHLVVNPLF